MTSSSSLPRTWKYDVFASFHGPDVRKGFLSHLRKQFNYNGITMFDDEKIVRGHTIAPVLIQGIRESRILIVILSRNYASSSWCLDELLEILKCKAETGQVVMTIFYGVDPSHVRKQTGDFGSAFNVTCACKTEERRGWSQALTDAANIAGENFQKWDNEAKMIEKIARDVSDKRNVTPSMDFDGIVGLEARLREMESLLDLDYDGVKMVGIWGPSGIGKTTIARALQSQLYDRFQLTCFVDNLRESDPKGLDEYGLKLRLQEEFHSKVMNQIGIQICHLGAMKENIRNKRVLVILDDVNNIKQLEMLANETTWFGPGSRVVVTTENQELLQQHGINNTNHVGFPSSREALEILCRYAFRQSYPRDGFEELALKVTELCGKLPLGLRVVGSSLRGKKMDEWEDIMNRLETILDHQDIEQVLRVGYESLHENEQSLFLHIAVFFNCNDGDLVKAMFADNKLDIKHGLEILASRSLIYISTKGDLVMHKLLQKVGIKAIHREEPWKRRILIDAQEISDVLERAKGTRAVSGISFDTSDTGEVYVSERGFKRMVNLRFLKVYKSKDDGNDRMHVPDNMDFPQRLRLLHWDTYPGKCLSRTFSPNYLVELNLKDNQLEKLWEGTQPLVNLKKMVLTKSRNLKELPDLSNATNLKRLELGNCSSLVEIPSSIKSLHKLELLEMSFCVKLQAVPSLLNLASLKIVYMFGCSQLRKIPNISTNITHLSVVGTMVEELLESIGPCSQLQRLRIHGSVYTHLRKNVTYRESSADIKKIPDCIKDLRGLRTLYIGGCPKLSSLPKLLGLLRKLIVDTCESLKEASLPLYSRVEFFHFGNCFALSQQVRRIIIQQSLRACLPGKTIPALFHHRAIGSSLTIRSDLYRFRLCVVVSPQQQMANSYLYYRTCINGCPSDRNIVCPLIRIRTKHLCILQCKLLDKDGWVQQYNEILFQFSTLSPDLDVIKCGVQILTD